MSTSFQQKSRRVTFAGDKSHSNSNEHFQTKHVRFQRFLNEPNKCLTEVARTVENLQQNRESLNKQQQHLQKRQQSLKLPTAGLCTQLVDDVLARGDFTVYQGGDLNDFFRKDPSVVPQRVSEVCLVNDHYILVKMPETCWRRNSQIECIVEEVQTSPDADPPKTAEACEHIVGGTTDRGACGGRKFSKYFQCNRNSRRVSPIQERSMEMEQDKLQTKSKSTVSTCWNSRAGDKEVFQTITKIQRNWHRTAAPHIEEVITNQPSLGLQKLTDEVKLQQENRDQTVSSIVDNLLGPILSDPEPELDFKLKKCALQTSIHDAVHLEHHGALETSNGGFMERTATSEAAATALTPALQAKKESQPRHRFIAFRWLLKPFRTRASKTIKPKSKIHAVIYKTYFVRWKRPPDTIWHGYGLRPAVSEELKDMPKLRRCRSAIF